MTSNTLTSNNDASNKLTTQPTQRVNYGRLWWVGLVAIVVATVANIVVRAIALPFITVPPEFLPLSIITPTVIFTAGGVLAAVIVFAIVGRFSRRPARIFTIIAIVALIISLVPNVAMLADPASSPFPGSNLGSVTVLMIQHVVAAVVAVWVLNTQAIETHP